MGELLHDTKWARALLFLINIYIKQWCIQYLSKLWKKRKWDLIKLTLFYSFGLFEAMSAIEMMDPKMDAGMMCNQIQRKVLTFDSALEVYIWFLDG